jgi:hypothetical protein
VDLLVVERHVKGRTPERDRANVYATPPPLLIEATALEVVTTVPVMQVAEIVVVQVC